MMKKTANEHRLEDAQIILEGRCVECEQPIAHHKLDCSQGNFKQMDLFPELSDLIAQALDQEIMQNLAKGSSKRS